MLVKAEKDRFKELFEAVDITRRISEFIWQWVPDRRISDQKSPGTAVRVESTARHNEPVSVGGTQPMSRCNFDGWSDVIGEVPGCLRCSLLTMFNPDSGVRVQNQFEHSHPTEFTALTHSLL